MDKKEFGKGAVLVVAPCKVIDWSAVTPVEPVNRSNQQHQASKTFES